MNYSADEYRKRVRGCFIGKCVGGTLGMPYEGKLSVNDVTYYNPVPTAMLGNDDLDLQVVALEIIRRRGLPVSARYLSDMWLDNVRCWPDEYGVAQKNRLARLFPPLSGHYTNKFSGGMGAAIRSELYACLAPADPDLAVVLCREDAFTDHYGDGADACAFLTAIESAAFIESDARRLIAVGLSYITDNIRMTRAFEDIIKWWDETRDMLSVRALILENYPSQNWTDVTINLSLIILAWLAGAGDFSKCVCAAASLGYDADCTCATLGAILGLIDVDAIEDKWTWPIGDQLVLSNNIVGMHEPRDILGFCAQIFETCCEVQRYYSSKCRLEGDLPAYTGARAWAAHPEVARIRDMRLTESLIEVSPLTVRLRYPEDVALFPGAPQKFALTLGNPGAQPARGEFELVASDGFSATGGCAFALEPGESVEIDIMVEMSARPRRRTYLNPLDIVFTLNGMRWTASAGLIPAFTWLTETGIVDSASNIALFGEGEHVFEIEFKAFTRMDNVRFICQGTRPLRVFMDGELLNEHDYKQYVPAIHRCKACVMIETLGIGWHKVRVEVQKGDNLPGEFFLMLGTRYGWEWLSALEWRAGARS